MKVSPVPTPKNRSVVDMVVVVVVVVVVVAVKGLAKHPGFIVNRKRTVGRGGGGEGGRGPGEREIERERENNIVRSAQPVHFSLQVQMRIITPNVHVPLHFT